MKKLTKILSAFALTTSCSTVQANPLVNVHLIELPAVGVSSVDASDEYVFFLEERGPKLKVATKVGVITAFEKQKAILPMQHVELLGFPEAKKYVSWEAIAISKDGKKAFLVSEDSEYGEYLLYQATIKYKSSGITLTLNDKPVWRGDGKITDKARTVRALNKGGNHQRYDNWNHGFEALAFLEDKNELFITHETNFIAPSFVDLNNNESKQGLLSNHQFRISDLTNFPQNGEQCMLGVSFCWNGDSSEICKSSANESALHVFGMSIKNNNINIEAQSDNLLDIIGTSKYNAEGIFLLGNYIYLVNDSSAPKGTISYLTRFHLDSFKKEQQFSNWMHRCSS